MYIMIIYIAVHIPPTRLPIATVITPCTQGHFAGNDARVVRPHRSENLQCTRGSAPDAGMCRQLLNIRVIRIPTIVSLLRPGVACTASSYVGAEVDRWAARVVVCCVSSVKYIMEL
jgi:hypothetical protein